MMNFTKNGDVKIMKIKYYIGFGISEYVYSKSYWKDMANDRNELIEIEECKRDIGGEMWCKEESEFVDTDCSGYAPCNKKSGRCRFLGSVLICLTPY
jgi:hypothetical protein